MPSRLFITLAFALAFGPAAAPAHPVRPPSTPVGQPESAGAGRPLVLPIASGHAMSVILPSGPGVPAQPCDRAAADPEAHLDGLIGHPATEDVLGPALRPCHDAVRDFPGEPRFAHELGRAYLAVHRPDLADFWFRQAIARNYAPAMRDRAELILLKQAPGLPAEADALLQRAIRAGEPGAFRIMAWRLFQGVEAPKDAALSMQWALAAARAGSPYAMWLISSMYRSGLGVPRDEPAAMNWDLRARRALLSGTAPALGSAAQPR